MAKKPSPTKTEAEATKAPATAPSQPWANPAAATKQESAPAKDDGGNAPAHAADTQNPPATPAPSPAAEQAEAHGNEQANKAEGNQLEADNEAQAEQPIVATDERDRLQQALESLTEDERDEFEAHMSREAKAALDRIVKRRAAVAMEANLVDGPSHYGKRIQAKVQEG